MLLYFSSDADYIARSNRFAGYSIRPVQGRPPVPVERVALDQTEIVLFVGETVTLNATVFPENATFTGMSWYYDYTSPEDPFDLTSDQEDKATLTAIAAGYATVTVLTHDGGKFARCKVTVKESAASAASAPPRQLKSHGSPGLTATPIPDLLGN